MLLNSIRTISHLYTLTLSITTLLIPTRVETAPRLRVRETEPDLKLDPPFDLLVTALYEEYLAKKFERAQPNKENKSSNEDLSTNQTKQMVNIYDQMQGDQPVSEGAIFMANPDPAENMRKTIEKYRKDTLIQHLKNYIYGKLGKNNSMNHAKTPEDPSLADSNITEFAQDFINTNSEDNDITEKIRGFYPSCEQAQSQDQEEWRDLEDIMDLSFDLGTISDTRNSNIASATLRLYRLPQNTTNTEFEDQKDDCKNLDSAEEEKLLRVSVYWYMKSQKKRRFKKQMSDSKVVPETTPWVELSVKPATKSWNRAANKNLRLGILVEDQENKILRADKYFKGPSCTVGVTTPIPIPSLVRDASEAGELNRITSHLGKNTTTTNDSNSLLPIVDICYLEVPANMDISQFNSARINACNLRKAHEEKQRLAEQEKLERLATAALHLPITRHIRHQRQHRQSQLTGLVEDFEKLEATDRRQISDLERTMKNSMSSKQILLTKAELESLQRDRSLDR